MTLIRQIPLLHVKFQLANNESWIDNIKYEQAGSLTGFPNRPNAGNGLLSAMSALPGAPLGTSTLVVTEVVGGITRYAVVSPDGTPLGIGQVGVPFAGGGLRLTLSQGSTPFAVNDGFGLTVLGAPLDLTGIRMDMQVRSSALRSVVMLYASTDPAVGGLVNHGVQGIVGIDVPRLSVQELEAGDYVMDILASDGSTRRRIVTGEIDMQLGSTRLA